ncbi:adenosylcobinamide kinase / adenosylcobinamide-phosphate guanylyltransferase [Sinosporangium album]|uniref:Adenosylcobinamide kinase n=1 Tax=Sinosporangium album TaxID=504805 RepID=A0A1G8IQ79_9ACTN|nr:bifunctional adenosylcobinamide kinase/adenosylcobinamide-phosphate guanylyltransferase [Sinosporangium album]SDI21002.1 adenosylcobinamide kinase / adenosylcobinamide-phosphate guanylyltransferase [Sinosporangium album]
MKVLINGSAGLRGWPEPGCGCASCARVSPGRRRPLDIVLDGALRLPWPAREEAPPPGFTVAAVPDGLAVTGPDGSRLLLADPALYGTAPLPSPGPSPGPDPGRGSGPGGGPGPGSDEATPYAMVLIDLLDRPERLGGLRRRGLVGAATHVVAVGVDHRAPSEAEPARRTALWGVSAVPDGTAIETLRPPAPGPAAPRRTLLLGGARSGKSAEAELRLACEPEVTYVATGPTGGDDPEWRRRVAEHRDRRPRHWATSETTDLVGLLAEAEGALLIDGLGTWLAAVFDECGAWEGSTAAVTDRCAELAAAWRRTPARVIAVSDEVGFGVVPATSSGRRFRDALGRLNQAIAAESDDVALVIAGRLLPLPI